MKRMALSKPFPRPNKSKSGTCFEVFLRPPLKKGFFTAFDEGSFYVSADHLPYMLVMMYQTLQ